MEIHLICGNIRNKGKSGSAKYGKNIEISSDEE